MFYLSGGKTYQSALVYIYIYMCVCVCVCDVITSLTNHIMFIGVVTPCINACRCQPAAACLAVDESSSPPHIG